MALGVTNSSRARYRAVSRRRPLLPVACLILALGSTSCVPTGAAEAPLALTDLPPLPEASPLPQPAPVESVATPSATPLAETFHGRTPLDRLRSLDCLAQAIYYEAASESEDGQRAVAQVVLNRVRHPAWPNSVCGVVYQGPLRPGGGCQFTFTCDGSLAVRPSGEAWAEARRLAAEALAGRVYAPVGLSTHYHTQAVFPSWAPGLTRTVTIGAHNFYRLPGRGGEAAAFTAHYAGSEPLPHPSMLLPRRRPMAVDLQALLAPPQAPVEIRAAVTLPSDIPQSPSWEPSNLPESTIREEYRHSGQWRDDAPAAITGAR